MKRFSVGFGYMDDGLVARYNQLYLIIQRFTETLVRIQCVRTGKKDIVNVDWLSRYAKYKVGDLVEWRW